MAVAISDLAPALEASLNAPGGSFFVATETQYVAALSNAFWTIRLKAFFTEWRLDGNDDIIPVVSGDEDMPREVQQLVVIMATVSAVEAKLLELDTTFRAVSGDQEFEIRKSASVLQEILVQKRAELEQLRKTLVETEMLTTSVGVVDMVLTRLGCASSVWVSG